MNNEIGRKLTSLTLLSILLASGITFAAPGAIPVAEAAHNANLFVSAENSQFNNYFAGPQVIEVVINDDDIDTLDDALGEPDVTVNGKKLRMAQATDGNWYGYFADRTQAQAADSTQGAGATAPGFGLDYGNFCASTSTGLSTPTANALFTDTVGVAVNRVATGGTNGNTAFTACTAVPNANAAIQNVVRENKTLNTNSVLGGKTGQIGISQDAWPVISLYDFSVGGNAVVIYNKGGSTQTTTLTFDTIPSNLINTSLDRVTYPLASQVHVTMTDPQLSIDPTDEDSWSWDTTVTNNRIFYQLFDENGVVATVTTGTTIPNLIGNLTTFMFEKNGKLTVDSAAQGSTVGFFNDNGDEVFGTVFSIGGGILGSTSGQLMTFSESGPKTGVFGNYDESDNANYDICSAQQSTALCPQGTAIRGKSAVIRYNDVSNSIVVGFGFATIDINAADGEWNSGEEVPVTLVDSDANRNSRADEDLDVNDPSTPLIPTLKIGTPFTLENGADFAIVGRLFTTNDNGSARFTMSPLNIATGAFNIRGLGAESASTVESFSQRAILNFTFPDFNGGTGFGASSNSTLLVRNSGGISLGTTTGADSALVIDLESGSTQRKLSDLQASLVDVVHTGVSSTTNRGINLFNYDIRSLNNTGGIALVDVYLLINTTKGTTTSTGFSIAAESTASNTIGKSLTASGFGSTGADETTGIRAVSLANRTTTSGIVSLNSSSAVTNNILNNVFARAGSTDNNNAIGLMFLFNQTGNFTISTTANKPIVADFFSFGLQGDGTAAEDRFNNAIYRFELEETGDNTSTFIGTAEYTMLNQLNIFTAATYTNLRTIDDEVTFIVHEDLDDEDAPRINYLDLGSDGVSTQIADQEDAGTHSATVSFDKDNYKIADTVTVTLEDQDLNVDSDLIDIYTTVAASASDPAGDAVGTAGLGTYLDGSSFGRLLDITFDDQRWVDDDTNTGTACTGANDVPTAVDEGLADTGFTLIETGIATGVFKGDFQIPSEYCDNTGTSAGTSPSTTGTDLEVNYVDFRDASGEIIEVGDGAGVRANTGSISLDRTVYPVPFGELADYGGATTGDSTPNGLSLFPIHATGISGSITEAAETIGVGDLNVIIRVNDPDFDISAAGEDKINSNTTGANPRGPVKVTVSRGSSIVALAYAGGDAVLPGPIGVGSFNATQVRQTGPMTETAPNAGIFEADLLVRYTDGPADAKCPATTVFTNSIGTSTTTETSRFSEASGTSANFCIIQGDILTVEYTDPTDASGDPNTVTDSATFDLRNGVLQSDKSVYIIGSDMILTLIEPDFDLDSDSAESYNLDLIEWDSDAATVTMGIKGGTTTSSGAVFDPEPSEFRETGDNTGIFQIVIEIPDTLGTERLDRGEEIQLEYTDWGPSGADFVGDEDEDINLTIYTSNFGATVELDQKVYTWTDKVFITIVAPDHNFDSNLIDTVGDSATDKVTVATRGNKLDNYHLVETGTDTGIFTGEVILTGFSFDADGNTNTGTATTGVDTTPITGDATGANPNNRGPTDGFLEADDDDGLTVSFEFTEDETVVGSALIRWNIGEVQFLEASYPASGQGVIRVVDPDMNLKPESVDNFDIDVWSDSDAGGIDLTVTETNEATGIFEGTVFFTVTDESSGHRLRVAEGDTVTAEYEDNTLPSPYTTADELEIDATTFIGSIVPPLERAPASNPRIVDAFGNELDEVSVDQQIQMTADLANGQDRDQSFAYLVQIQDEDGVTISLSWITGSLAPGQSLNPAQSWTPTSPGTYNVQIFVWESVDNPDALSPPVSTTISVV